MVLAELGYSLKESLRKLHSSSSNNSTSLSQTVNEVLTDITRALIEADVNILYVKKLKDSIQQKVEPMLDDWEEQHQQQETNMSSARTKKLVRLIQKTVIDELVNLLSTTTKPYVLKRGKPNICLFVGLQGAGKTTTVAKFAHYHQRRGYKTAMVCADTFRAGAFDQLRQNATKLRIPFYGSYTLADPVQIASDGVAQFVKDGYELILVDTSGRHKQEAVLLEEMQELADAVHPHNTVLVMDATQGQSLYDQALAFHNAVGVGSVIVTKLDGHAKGGGALSAVAATQSPILFLGTGEHFDDLDPFHPQSFVSKLLGFGDVRGLIQSMKDSTSKQSQEELMDKMSKGEFTLRDMYNQFQRVMNMGPLNKLVGMLPGMPDYLIPKGNDQESTHRLRKFMVMMDSMNNAELDGKVDMHKKYDDGVESRIRRIAAGSGCHPNEVKMLLLAHKQFESMVSKMGKSGMMGKQGQARQQQLVQQMRKNPNLINQRLNQMDPNMLQQLGGRDQVMAMMQQMAKGGGGGMPPLGGGGGGMPDMGGMDMDSIMRMAQSMGMGGPGGLPPGAGRR